MDLNEMRARYEREEGYSCLNATARVCQDVILVFRQEDLSKKSIGN